jgi:hypothetical protein
MAPPRKPPEPGHRRQVFIRLPEDISERIDAKAKAEGRPINRVIINELASWPHFAGLAALGDQIRDMGVILARHGSRLSQVELGEDLLRAVDETVTARTDSQLRAAADRLRVIRAAMLESERRVANMEREQLAGQIKLLELKIAVIAALPDSALDKDRLPSLRDELARLQQAAVVAADGK